MIAGASQADFGVLVVDAAKGASEARLEGQTEEQVRLLSRHGSASLDCRCQQP